MIEFSENSFVSLFDKPYHKESFQNGIFSTWSNSIAMAEYRNSSSQRMRKPFERTKGQTIFHVCGKRKRRVLYG